MFFNRNRGFSHISRSEREFRMFRIVFWVMFTIVAVMILTIWSMIGFGIYTVATNPNGTAEQLGSLVGTFIEAAQTGSK